MTKLETLCPDIIPGFDVLQWKQENQARILRETQGMTRVEIHERLRQAAERADCRRAELSEHLATESPT